MNILITGATGFIGSHVLRALVEQQHSVTACVRNPEKILSTNPLIHPIAFDFAKALRVDDWLADLQDIDVVINCVGIIAETRSQSFLALHAQAPIALFKAAEQAGVSKIIQISALGADATALSNYHLSKKQADDALRQMSLSWFVLQPSIVYGDGAKSMPLFQALAAQPIQVAIDGGEQLMQPIHIDDLVTTVLRCLAPETQGQQTLELVGPKAMRFNELLRRLRKRIGKSAALEISVAGSLVEKTAFIGRWLGEPTMTAENIRMLRQGNHADAHALHQFLGRPATSLDDNLLDRPATQAECWHAQLYFMRPVIRVILALVWIWSGVVSIYFYPLADSYQLLAATGITGPSAPYVLYGLALTDIVLGLALLTAFQLRKVITLQIVIVLSYMLVISLALPEYWLHPFGPLIKNFPLILLTLVYGYLEEV